MKILQWLCVVAVSVCYSAQGKDAIFTLTSSAFTHNSTIPAQYTCDGKNISPALYWSGAPKGTKSFALIVDDPDAQEKTGEARRSLPSSKARISEDWTHWVVFNISAATTELPEGVEKGNFISGVTDFYHMQHGVWKYGGPCPPRGKHHYHFKLYALDTMLELTADAEKDDVVAAMKGHILAQAELVGLYARKK